MVDLKTELLDDKLTQADLIKLMLHNAQHMATREEVKSDIDKLDTKIDKVEVSLKKEINKLDTKIDKVEVSLKAEIKDVEASLKKDIEKVEVSLRTEINKLDKKIDKVDSKFDRLQWLIVATIMTVLLKDYILAVILGN